MSKQINSRRSKLHRVLYYPSIEIGDVGWLNSMALFWDQISTITPNVEQPYGTDTSKEFMDAGILVPYKANPKRREIVEISEEISGLLGNPYFEALFTEDHWLIHQSRRYRVHPEKIESNLRHRLEESGFARTNREGWVEMNAGLAAAYMLLLSIKISGSQGFSLITDQVEVFRASGVARLQEFHPSEEHLLRFGGHRDTRAMEFIDACINELSLSWFRIDPDVPPKNIIRYREKRKDELQRMRDAILRANSRVFTDSDASLDDLRNQAKDYVHSSIQPAYDDLCNSLKDERINYLPDVLTAALYSEGVGALAATLGQSWPLIAAPICGIAVRSVKYLNTRQAALRNSPWSYLYHAEKKFGVQP